jgi:hypothetical protein
LEQQSIVYLCQGRKTIIEGVVYYDVKKDEFKGSNRKKNELIGQLLQEKKGAYARTKRKEKEYHCDSEELQ